MEQAIKKAIEGGYKVRHFGEEYVDHFYKCSILLDPLFWQSLGKAMGWSDTVELYTKKGDRYVMPESVPISLSASKHDIRQDYERVMVEKWVFEMHRFIDHLIAGKDADSFFNELFNSHA